MPNTIDSITGLKKKTFPLITFAGSFLITLLCIVFVALSQKNSLMSTMNGFAEHQTQSLRAFIRNDVAYIGSGANFFYSNDREDWGKFDRFAQQTVNASKSLIGLQWMEKVTLDQIAEHTHTMQQRFPSYRLYTIPKDGPVTLGYIMDGRPIYVASDIYPQSDANTELLGFYSSRQRFQMVIDNIVETREANLSDKVRLLQDGLDKGTEKTGMLVYHPVFKGYGNELLGVVIGVVRTTFYFENLIASTIGDIDVYIRVTDTGFDAEDDPILFKSPGFDDVAGHQITKTITLTNRDWKVDFRIGETITDSGYLVLTGITLIGTVVSLLLAYIVNLQVREKQRISVQLDIRTQELRYLVEHDSLTDVFNRRAFNKQLNTLIEGKSIFSLVGFDIDKFKLVNDKYGHPAGDALLKSVCKLINDNLNQGDALFRLGGDEFCIITKVNEAAQLKVYLEFILATIEHSSVTYQSHTLTCTLSIGAAIFDGENFETLLNKTDRALYKSKSNGRNRVTIAGEMNT